MDEFVRSRKELLEYIESYPACKDKAGEFLDDHTFQYPIHKARLRVKAKKEDLAKDWKPKDHGYRVTGGVTYTHAVSGHVFTLPASSTFMYSASGMYSAFGVW